MTKGGRKGLEFIMKELMEDDERIIRILKWTVGIVAVCEVILGFIGWYTNQHMYMYALSAMCIGALVLSLVHGTATVGWKNVVIIFLIGMIGSLFFESMGVNFGLFFSKYTYTGVIPGPKIFGFDVFSMVAYGFAVYEFWTLGQVAVGMFDNRFHKGDVILVPIVSGLLFVAIDLGTDPLLASVSGAYDWVQEGVYYGVPYQNYLGWIVMAITIMMCISLLLYSQQKRGTLPEAPSVARRKWFWKAPALLYGALYIQMPFYALIRENTEFTVYSGQTFQTHDVYWGVAIVYLCAVFVPALIMWARVNRAQELVND